MSDKPIQFKLSPETFYLLRPEVDLLDTVFLRVEPGPRIFVNGTDETSDVERIGEAFKRWAAAAYPPGKEITDGRDEHK